MKILKSRTIDVYPKHSSANTQYYEMDSKDEAWMYYWLHRVLSDMNEECTWDPEVCKDWHKRRPNTFPKSWNGPNSYASIIGGICRMKLQNAKKNLSEPQLESVELVFQFIAQYYDSKEETEKPEAIRFLKKLFPVVE